MREVVLVSRVGVVPGRRRWVSFRYGKAAGEVPGSGCSLSVEQSGVSLRERRRSCSDEAVVEEWEVVAVVCRRGGVWLVIRSSEVFASAAAACY
jgi:hypothetical protein